MRSVRILVIEDEDDVRDIVQAGLELVPGWKALPARSGPEGIALAKAERPNAILLDMMMPELDGIATCQALKSDPATRSIPVILLTAKVLNSDWQQFSGLEFDAVIPKPFDPLSLGGEICGILGWDRPPG